MTGLQLRYETGLTGEEYVKAEAWRDARLERCPNHPQGGCSVANHGTYGRKSPPGAKVPCWYCPESHTTFSLLPDCLAARLPGTLDDLEAVVVAAEGARSLEAAANDVRPDAVELSGALRWIRRRVRLVHDILVRVIGLSRRPVGLVHGGTVLPRGRGDVSALEGGLRQRLVPPTAPRRSSMIACGQGKGIIYGVTQGIAIKWAVGQSDELTDAGRPLTRCKRKSARSLSLRVALTPFFAKPFRTSCATSQAHLRLVQRALW